MHVERKGERAALSFLHLHHTALSDHWQRPVQGSPGNGSLTLEDGLYVCNVI